MNKNMFRTTDISRAMQKGFTLIELLVVVAIISMLSSVILASLGTARTEGTDTQKIEDMEQLKSALQLYSLSNSNEYPQVHGNAQNVLTSYLIPKYIGSIDPNILYQSLNSTIALCTTGTLCPSYQIGVPLTLKTNLVLTSDSNIDIAGGVIDGQVDNCVSGTASSPDLCYDIVPN
jgi:prepilin-type N-terminal cleavage/methylation domain-containing protein